MRKRENKNQRADMKSSERGAKEIREKKEPIQNRKRVESKARRSGEE